MSIILNGFTNEQGETFDNIRDIHFNNPGDILTELGSPIYQSEGLASPNQVKIYRMPNQPGKALRLDKNFLNYRQIDSHDDVFISKLQEYQKNVLLTEFPTGVVTIEDKVIGQEIPFYEKSIPISKAAKTRQIKSWEKTLSASLDILKILRELINSGIYYQDIHGYNFLYNIENGKINLIDFDSRYIKFEYNEYKYNSMVNNFKLLIGFLTNHYGIRLSNDFDHLYSFEEIEEYLQTEHYKILKRTNR